MEDKHEDYHTITHEEWCYLLYTTEVKGNKKRAAAYIKRLSTYKAAPINYDINNSVKVPLKNKARG